DGTRGGVPHGPAVRRHILVPMVLVTAAAMALFAIPLGAAAARLFRGRQEIRLERQATRAIGALPATGLHGADPVELPKAPRRMQLAVYDARGARVAGQGPAHGPSEVTGALRGRVTDDRDGKWLAVAVPVQDEERVVGATRAAVPWAVVTEDTYTSWLVMAGFAGLAIAIAAGLAWWLSSRLAAPVDRLAHLAVRLGNGDFSARYAPAGVSELDGAGEALNRTAARLGDVLARERSFTADASHQLATPLTSLRLGLESALLTPGTDSTATINRSLEEVERLQATVATLLAVARDVEPPSDARTDVEAVCADVVDRYREALARDGRPLRLDVQRGLPAVRCPPDVLREILSVLIDNAGRHGRGTVAITSRAAGRGVVVEVTDEGPGISGDPSTVFDRRAPGAVGHGIGLSLARSLAEAHDARLELTRAAPHPSFTVALPGAPPSA
ncbi:MAG: hypothetical protein QOJ09_2386, partial [Actinomycetota bacterium]|nr:hypothetical protein [Actinomycetota bacterium]